MRATLDRQAQALQDPGSWALAPQAPQMVPPLAPATPIFQGSAGNPIPAGGSAAE